MKNALLKFANLFVEKVPVEKPADGAKQQSASTGQKPITTTPLTAPAVGGIQQATPPAKPLESQGLKLALRAWIPEEYVGHLAPHGATVIAAGGEITSEDAQRWGANVLVISSECLGQNMELIRQPKLPTVFVTPKTVTLPDIPGLVQVLEPIRASELAAAAKLALTNFSQGR